MREDAAAVGRRERNWVWWSFQLLIRNICVFAFRYRVRGLENLPDGGALFLINHQSFIDPLVAAVAFQRPVSYLARNSLYSVPIIGWILKRTFTIPIQRSSAASESIRLAVARLQEGAYVGIFPEGTRSADGKLQEIKPGFLAIVRRADVPLVPIGIAGARHVFPRGAFFLQPRTVRVVIGAPIPLEVSRKLSQRGHEAEFVELVRVRISEAVAAAENWLAGNPSIDIDSNHGSKSTGGSSSS